MGHVPSSIPSLYLAVHHDQVPERLRARTEEIVALTTAFASAHLDNEYAELCRRMTAMLARKRPAPIERGDARAWAAGIVHAVEWVNFLGDPPQEPHVSSATLATRIGVAPSTIAARARTIRDALRLERLDPAWTRPSRLLDNPMAWIVMVDGVPVDLRDAPRALQEEAFAQGLIPFVPGPVSLVRSHEDGATAQDPPGDTADPDPRDDAPAASDVRTMIQDAVDRLLASNPVTTPGQLDAALADVLRDYNHRPQRELGGLAPATVHRLVAADWESPESAVRLDDALPLGDLGASHTLHNARVVLSLLAEQGEVRATTKGNLPRAFVTASRARMHASPTAHVASYITESAASNEDDVVPLHIVRTLLELAGLIKQRRGRFSCTVRGARLGGPEQAGALLAALVRTHFRRFNLAYLDGIGPAPAFQHTIGYTLYRFSEVAGTWTSRAALVDALLLPDIRAELPDDARFDVRGLMLETRLLRPLEEFGLAESELEGDSVRGADPLCTTRHRYRKSSLFDRLLHFDVGTDEWQPHTLPSPAGVRTRGIPGRDRASVFTRCRYGEVVEIGFALDCCDRECLAVVAEPRALTGAHIRRLMHAAAAARLSRRTGRDSGRGDGDSVGQAVARQPGSTTGRTCVPAPGTWLLA